MFRSLNVTYLVVVKKPVSVHIHISKTQTILKIVEFCISVTETAHK
jgi:hypothetical protein